MGCSDCQSIYPLYNNNFKNCKEKEYPLFQKNFWFDYIQNINKIYAERLIDTQGNHILMTHKIYLTLNYKENRMAIIQIEEKKLYDIKSKSESKEYSINIQVLNGCSLEYLRDYIERYNGKFKIDSSKWFNINKTTDIIIKVEKTDNEIKGFEMMYDKKASTLNYHKIDNPGLNAPYENVYMENLNSLRMIDKYNQLNSELESKYSDFKNEKEKAEYESKPREWIEETKKEEKNN